MKQLAILLLLIVFNYTVVYSQTLADQTTIVPSSTRKTITDIYGTPCSITGATLPNTEEITIDKNLRFSVMYQINEGDDSYIVIEIWKSSNDGFNKKYRGDDLQGLHYIKVQKELIENNTVEFGWYSRKWEPVAGPLIVPVKIRLKPFDFTSDVSFGAAIGVVGRFSRVVESNKYTFLLTTGVSSVTVDSATTKGEYESSQDLPAFYVAAGAVISLRNNFTLGFFGGIDLLSNNSVENWAYQGKPWIGVGLGITMFNLSGVQKKTVNPKQL